MLIVNKLTYLQEITFYFFNLTILIITLLIMSLQSLNQYYWDCNINIIYVCIKY